MAYQKRVDQLQTENKECKQREQTARMEAKQQEEQLASLTELCQSLQATGEKARHLERELASERQTKTDNSRRIAKLEHAVEDLRKYVINALSSDSFAITVTFPAFFSLFSSL